MELQPLTSITTLSLFLMLMFKFFMVMINKSSKKRSSTTNKVLPGPRKLPLIGNLHSFVGALPHHALRKLSSKYGPIMHLRLGELSTVVVSSPEMAEEVMKTQDLAFAGRPKVLASEIVAYNSQDIVFGSYGPYLIQMRKICTTELLSSQTVRTFRSIREHLSLELVESIRSTLGSPFNISAKMSSLASVLIATAAFGKRCEHQDELLPLIDESISRSLGLCVPDLFPSLKILDFLSGTRSKLEKVHREMDAILNSIIKEHKEKLASVKHDSSKDKYLLHVLLQLQESGNLEYPFTDDNIKALILDMFVAGTDGTSSTVEWAMSELLRNPDVMAKLQAELRQTLKGKTTVLEADIQSLSYFKCVIKETLRLHPPGPLLVPRESREECEIDGYKIPAKTRVLVNAWAILRDPEHWPDAEEFLPERFEGGKFDYNGTDFRYIPFGSGRRICPGINFALSSVELPLAQMLYHFDWKLPNGMNREDLDMTDAFGLGASRDINLLAVATPYNP